MWIWFWKQQPFLCNMTSVLRKRVWDGYYEVLVMYIRIKCLGFSRIISIWWVRSSCEWQHRDWVTRIEKLLESQESEREDESLCLLGSPLLHLPLLLWSDSDGALLCNDERRLARALDRALVTADPKVERMNGIIPDVVIEFLWIFMFIILL